MEKGIKVFLVTGRMGKSLVYSKALPFVLNPAVSEIFIFSQKEGMPLDKTKYILIPTWITAIRPLFLSRFLRQLYEPFQLICKAICLKPHLINGYHIIPKGINSLLAARISHARCIISLIGGTVEVETYSRFRFVMKRINLFALKQSDLVTTKGSVVNKYLEKHRIHSSKIICYNGSVDINKFYPDPYAEREIDVIFSGTFRNLKGPDRVIRMIYALKKNHVGIKACFLGDGYLFETCKELTSKLDLNENISFMGHVEEPAGFFRKSKVLVMPSRSEGLPTSMLEAMACGCVPVVSRVGNIEDAAIHGENAFLVNDYKDIDTFATFTHTLLSDDNFRNKMATHGISTVLNRYSPEKQSLIIREILQKLNLQNVTD